MNSSMIQVILGHVLKIEAAFMLLPCLISIIYGERQGLMYLLVATVCIVVGFVFSYGYFNTAIFKDNPISWYTEPKYWPLILTIVHIWQNAGQSSIIYMASIGGIDNGLYESARIDGATKWEQIKYITLPLLKPMITMMLLLSVGRIFNSDFGLFYQVPLGNGMLYSTTQTIDTFVYRALMVNNNVGMSSAAGIFQAVIGFVLVLSSNLIVRKINPENSLF